MAANINPQIIKRTQETLGKYVKKPVLSEKLLKKPPFRFLYDVVCAVITETGFLKGLYTEEELKYESIKDKDDKIEFLQKLIDAVKLVTNDQNLKVKPSKIVAGHEPEKTNELLQAIGVALDKQLDTSQIINSLKTAKTQDTPAPPKKSTKSVVAGTKTNESNKKANPVPSKGGPEKNIATKNIESNKGKSSKLVKDNKIKEKVTKKPSKISSQVNQNDELIDVIDQEAEKRKMEKLDIANVELQRVLIENNNSPREKKLKKMPMVKAVNLEKPFGDEILVEKQDEMNAPNQTKSDEHKIKSIKELNEANAENEITAVEESSKVKGENSANEDLKKAKVENNINIMTDLNKSSETAITTITKDPKDIKSDIKDSNKSKTVDELNESNIEHKINPIKDLNKVKPDEKPPLIRPKTSLRPPSMRPASARPGAPKRRDRNIEIILKPDEVVQMAGISIKAEDLDDEGDNLVIIEAVNVLEKNSSNLNLNNLSEDKIIEQGHGHLVQQILETQKEFSEIDQEVKRDLNKTDIGWDNNRQRLSSAKQMDNLRESIQTLTRSVNPLGKLMDFLQEDIDSMQMEVSQWQTIFASTKLDLKNESGLTETAIQPLRHQLADLENSKREIKEIINSSRINILQNEEKIYNLLSDL